MKHDLIGRRLVLVGKVSDSHLDMVGDKLMRIIDAVEDVHVYEDDPDEDNLGEDVDGVVIPERWVGNPSD